jgi:hypothetical protein
MRNAPTGALLLCVCYFEARHGACRERNFVRKHKTHISARRAEALLFPIAAFLRAGGLSKLSATQRLGAAFDRADRLSGARKIEHIGRPVLYSDIVARWSHDSRYLDRAGRPRNLSIKGKNQFSSLIREIDAACDPRIAMAVLVRFGNVRKAPNGTYKLVRPLFFTSTNRAMAFEPLAYFLSDASSTLGRILRRTRRTRGPELFWRKVECTGLSAENARKFVEFVRERGQEFLEEVDDWLEGRAKRRARPQQHGRVRRVGLGLFSIDSSNDLSHTSR